MARHRARPGARQRLIPLALVLALAVLLVVAVARYRARESSVVTDRAAGACTRVVRVVTAASFAPVLQGLAPHLGQGSDCVSLRVEVADGRSAPARVAQTGADLWIPDDTSWAGIAGSVRLSEAASVGAGSVVATSPVYMVTDQGTANRLRTAGASWLALAHMVAGANARLVVRDPGEAGDGLVAMGAVAESVWLDRGMDTSALWLTQAKRATRTVSGRGSALPVAPGEVGLVPEYALSEAPPGMTLVPGSDHSVMLRYTWLPTAAAAGAPDRVAALERIRRELSSPEGVAALAGARLRGPDAAPLPGDGVSWAPALTAKPLDVLQEHHVEHVFATWYVQDRRTNVTVVVDVSGSMAAPAPGSSTPLIELVRQGCRTLGPLLPDNAELGLWEFGVKLDGSSDHRVLLPFGALDQKHRQGLADAVAALRVQNTGTGLYDTILAAYTAARNSYQAGTTNQVLVFTDGRNEDDPGSISAEQLAALLAAAKDPKRPVLLSIVAFGQRPEANVLTQALKPVDGYVDAINTSDEVAAVFIHVAAGGLHG